MISSIWGILIHIRIRMLRNWLSDSLADRPLGNVTAIGQALVVYGPQWQVSMTNESRRSLQLHDFDCRRESASLHTTYYRSVLYKYNIL